MNDYSSLRTRFSWIKSARSAGFTNKTDVFSRCYFFVVFNAFWSLLTVISDIFESYISDQSSLSVILFAVFVIYIVWCRMFSLLPSFFSFRMYFFPVEEFIFNMFSFSSMIVFAKCLLYFLMFSINSFKISLFNLPNSIVPYFHSCLSCLLFSSKRFVSSDNFSSLFVLFDRIAFVATIIVCGLVTDVIVQGFYR